MDAQFLAGLAETAAEVGIPELQDLENAIITNDNQCLSNSVINVCLVETKSGSRYVIKSPNSNMAPPLTSAAIARDVETRRRLLQISEGCCTHTLGYSKTKAIVVEEDTSDFDVLQHRLLVEDKVDHGITCDLARLVAKIHKATHKDINEGTFNEIRSNFGTNPATDFHVENLFVKPFQDGNISKIENANLKKKAQDLIASPEFARKLADIKVLFQDNTECLILGNLNSAGIVTKNGKVKVSDAAFATVGPCAFDLGCILADYIVVYHSQILTEQDNHRHRQVAYSMVDAIRKTVEAYTEENSLPVKAGLISQASAFCGLELLRRSLLPCEGHIPISDSARTEIFQSGSALFARYDRIDKVGRMLMIGVHPC